MRATASVSRAIEHLGAVVVPEAAGVDDVSLGEPQCGAASSSNAGWVADEVERRRDRRRRPPRRPPTDGLRRTVAQESGDAQAAQLDGDGAEGTRPDLIEQVTQLAAVMSPSSGASSAASVRGIEPDSTPPSMDRLRETANSDDRSASKASRGVGEQGWTGGPDHPGRARSRARTRGDPRRRGVDRAEPGGTAATSGMFRPHRWPMRSRDSSSPGGSRRRGAGRRCGDRRSGDGHRRRRRIRRAARRAPSSGRAGARWVIVADAGAVPEVFLTAWDAWSCRVAAMSDAGPGPRGCFRRGHPSIALASYLGADIIVTASAGKADARRRLGADVVVDDGRRTSWRRPLPPRAVRASTSCST